MAGYRHPRNVSEAEKAQLDEVRMAVWNAHKYRDRLPARGLDRDGIPALTGTDPKDVGKYVIVTVRDPLGGEGEVPHGLRLAQRFGPARKVGGTGLFQVYTAEAGAERVTVVATGSGSPEIELAMVELLEHSDAEVFVYFGTAAGLHPYAVPGKVIISTGVVRDEGMTRDYVESSYPAVSSYELVTAFVTGAETEGVQYQVGVTRSIDSDILGNGRPTVSGYMQQHHADLIDYWIRAGALSNDREAAAVVTLGNLFGRRTGVVLGITDNYPMSQAISFGLGMDEAARTLVAGLKYLIAMDTAKAAANRENWGLDLVPEGGAV